MTTEIILVILRCISGLLLFAFLVILLIVIWREFTRTTSRMDSHRRTYGRLTGLREIDGRYLTTGETFPLLPITSLGRSPSNSIRIDDAFASSEHAVVALRGGQWWLEDRQSRNGTTLNDSPVTQPMVITNGDIIGVGSAKFRLEVDA